MGTIIFSILAFIMILSAIFFYLRSEKFKRNSIKTTAKVIEINTFSYFTPGMEYNSLYHTSITPLLEIDINGEVKKINYNMSDEVSDLSIGDEVEVLIDKENIEEIRLNNSFSIYKEAIALIITSIFFILVSIIFYIL